MLVMPKCFIQNELTYWFKPARCEGIPNVVLDAGADRNMVHHRADCIDPAGSRARVKALVSLACFVGGAVRIDHTLRPACHIWVSKVFWNTAAGTRSVSGFAHCIASTRGRVAGINV